MFSRLLILMVLTSAAATTQTTILPNARTMLSMAFHKAIAPIFGRTHPRYLTPTFSTLSFGVISVLYYVGAQLRRARQRDLRRGHRDDLLRGALSRDHRASRAAWHYRSSLSAGVGAAFSLVVMPALSGVALYAVSSGASSLP